MRGWIKSANIESNEREHCKYDNKTQVGALETKEYLGPREIENPCCTIIEEPGGTDTRANGSSGREEYNTRCNDQCV